LLTGKSCPCLRGTQGSGMQCSSCSRHEIHIFSSRIRCDKS
jgi:hypothetical protein